MNTRREFLLRLFALLDERGLAFVVLRNFDRVFDDNGSDVDLLTHPREVGAFFTAALDAAAQTGHRLVQRARFVNRTWVFWNGAESFTRVDLDTEIRWRCFTALTAASVLATRRPHGGFSVPSPAHEVEILRVQIAMRSLAQERYLRRLAELETPPTNPARERRRLMRQAVFNPLRWPGVVASLAGDAVRIAARWRHPPGLAVSVVAAGAFDEEPLRRALAVLFPLNLRVADSAPLALRRTLFKCGLALQVERVSSDAGLALAARRLASRGGFVAVRESSGRLHAGHVASGFMLSGAAVGELTRFICTVLARVHETAPVERGVSVLLVGLDGAGKSTFARNLCAAALATPRFSGCCYFHWIPQVMEAAEFPWPVFHDLPRKTATPRGLVPAFSSALRLVRNVVFARLAWFFRVAPALRAGRLVVLDRFMSNYWLDPASVRYSGPPGWLELARRFLPRPDVLFALDAAASILRARKDELTPEQIAEQQSRLRTLPPLARRRVDLDAALSPDALVREALTLIEDP